MRKLLVEDRTLAERHCEARARAVYLGADRLLCRVLGQYLMFVSASDVGITPHLALGGQWEFWITQALAAYVQPGMTVVDVGANCGYYTVLAADLVGDTGRVVSIEPQGRLLALLRASLEANGFANRVTLCDCAVSDARSEALLIVPHEHSMNASLARPPPSGPRPETVRVVTRTLDDLLGQVARVDFIKIDAECSEPAIWRGMQTVLARHNPVVLMEHHGAAYVEAGLDPAWIREALAGYSVAHADYDGKVKAVSVDAVLADPGRVWMLWIQKRRG